MPVAGPVKTGERTTTPPSGAHSPLPAEAVAGRMRDFAERRRPGPAAPARSRHKEAPPLAGGASVAVAAGPGPGSSGLRTSPGYSFSKKNSCLRNEVSYSWPG
jgi:hypothetical protein